MLSKEQISYKLTCRFLELLCFDIICIRFKWIMLCSVKFIPSNSNNVVRFKFLSFFHVVPSGDSWKFAFILGVCTYCKRNKVVAFTENILMVCLLICTDAKSECDHKLFLSSKLDLRLQQGIYHSQSPFNNWRIFDKKWSSDPHGFH